MRAVDIGRGDGQLSRGGQLFRRGRLSLRETLRTDDPSDASYTDGDSSSIDSDVGGASDEDSDASWLPSDLGVGARQRGERVS